MEVTKEKKDVTPEAAAARAKQDELMLGPFVQAMRHGHELQVRARGTKQAVIKSYVSDWTWRRAW